MQILKWIGLILIAAISLFVVGCSTIGLPHVSYKPKDFTPTPDLLAPIGGMEQVTTAEDWRSTRAPFWTDMLLSQVYGTIPDATPVEIVSDEIITTNFLDGAAAIRAVRLKLTIGEHDFLQDVHFVVPNLKGPHPVILGAGSCPNASVRRRRAPARHGVSRLLQYGRLAEEPGEFYLWPLY